MLNVYNQNCLKAMKVKIIIIDGVSFMVQSYLKDNFCHIVSVIEKHSISISLHNLKIDGGYGKQDVEWINYCKQLNIEKIKEALDSLFKPIYNQLKQHKKQLKLL